MSRTDRAAKAKRLYERFVAPLVLGGDLSPGPAIGARDALSLDGGLATVDPDVRSAVDVGRVRVARRLVPVDTLEDPGADEWALAAALHDLVHALHPRLGRVPFRGVADRLIDLAEQVIDRVPVAQSLAEELSRHSLFARMFDIQRTDTHVSWWTGSAVFMGEDPPPRLLAWPEVRRVHTDETTRSLADLPGLALGSGQMRFWPVLDRWLARAPLTDLATCARPAPAFAWSGATLGLLAGTHGRVLGLRALALAPAPSVDAALGRATHALVKTEAWDLVDRVATVLADRALVVASADGHAPRPVVDMTAEARTSSAYAQAIGAAAALARVESLAVSLHHARAIEARLLPALRAARGREVEAVMARLSRPPK